MIVLGFSIWASVRTILIVTLCILVAIILYRLLLRRLGRGTPIENDYCVLFNLEKEPASGELEFYFTSPEKKNFALQILDENMGLVEEVVSKESFSGGNIIRFDSSKLQNGHYYYCLKTDNQKTMKKMIVSNA